MNVDHSCLVTGEVPETIDGVNLLGSRRPSSIDELGEILSDGMERDTAIYPVGGGVALDFGLPPARPGYLLDTTHLRRVDDYPSEDMTITVEAGIRLADLAEILAEKHQCLPIDAGSPQRATLGGLIASGHSGPRRLGYGTPRDYVIGIDCVHADGKRVHGGGRVVKNVAGYDFMKLHTGAFGTLGVIATVTLKLKPLPACKQALLCDVVANNAENVLAALNRSPLRPVGIELLNASARKLLGNFVRGNESCWLAVLLFEESTPAVRWQMQEATKLLQNLGSEHVVPVEQDRYDELLDILVQWRERLDAKLVFKANVLPSKVADFLMGVELFFPNASVGAHAGNGIVWGAIPSQDGDEIMLSLPSLRRMAAASGGNLVLPRCPIEWKQSLAVWGDAPRTWHLMKRLKHKLDSKDILNSGRLFPAKTGAYGASER